MSRSKSSWSKTRLLKWVRLIHSYSAMAVLVSMLFFAVTGLTLNHRDWIPVADELSIQELALPANLFAPKGNLSRPMIEVERTLDWLRESHGLSGRNVRIDLELDEQLLVFDIKNPGGYSLVEVDVASRSVVIEQQEYGAWSTLNDLHMGRNSGAVWSWFIDLSAIAMLLFSLTGLVVGFSSEKASRQNAWSGRLPVCCLCVLSTYWLFRYGFDEKVFKSVCSYFYDVIFSGFDRGNLGDQL